MTGKNLLNPRVDFFVVNVLNIAYVHRSFEKSFPGVNSRGKRMGLTGKGRRGREEKGWRKGEGKGKEEVKVH